MSTFGLVLKIAWLAGLLGTLGMFAWAYWDAARAKAATPAPTAQGGRWRLHRRRTIIRHL